MDVDDPQGSRGHSEPSVALSDVEEDRPGSDSDFAVGSERADDDLQGDAENSAADSPGSDFGSSHGCASNGHAHGWLGWGCQVLHVILVSISFMYWHSRCYSCNTLNQRSKHCNGLVQETKR